MAGFIFVAGSVDGTFVEVRFSTDTACSDGLHKLADPLSTRPATATGVAQALVVSLVSSLVLHCCGGYVNEEEELWMVYRDCW